MKSRPPADRHVHARTALDYLDRTLDEAGRREVEAHLALPCAACRERMRELGSLLQRMRDDRVPMVPESVRARALDAFAAAERPVPARALAELLARLVFDSWTDPLPAAARRAVGEARRLRFALDGGTLELECEPESPGLATLRGRLAIADAALHRVLVAVGPETRAVFPDAGGAFALDHVPAGEAHLTIEGPAIRHRIPPLTM